MDLLFIIMFMWAPSVATATGCIHTVLLLQERDGDEEENGLQRDESEERYTAMETEI